MYAHFDCNIDGFPVGCKYQPKQLPMTELLMARIHFESQADLKVGKRFADSDGSDSSFRGFYRQVNPNGLKPKIEMLVLSLGYSI